MIEGLDHIQLAMPAGEEDKATAFYAGVLGLKPVAKPAALDGRGGVWFQGPGLALHMGVEDPFRPARKAHPAFRVTSLDATKLRLSDHDIPWRPDADLPGITRVFVDDPFGNRIELLERLGSD